MNKILIIQTAFIGDVILATPVIEKLHRFYPDASIDFLLRKGNEGLLMNHPFIHKTFIFNKKEKKYRHLFSLIRAIRKEKYDLAINLQRFATSGIITLFSGARRTIGFEKNPLSIFFSKRVRHVFGNEQKFIHEVDRNLSLIESITDKSFESPVLYPATDDFKKASAYTNFICIAPTSVWFTKQLAQHKWIEFMNLVPWEITILLLGAPSDVDACENIIKAVSRDNVINMAGKLSFLESAALMKVARMNYVNDSAPLHLCSAVDAPVTAVFCSTIPAFGFTPLSSNALVVETELSLSCRPCGLHGFKECPQGHFKCAEINIQRLLDRL